MSSMLNTTFFSMPSVAKFAALASILLAIGVILSAFGAHALRDRLDEYHLGVYEKASFYHLLHAVGMLSVCALAGPCGLSDSSLFRICVSLTLGILLFSGSLYLLAITGVKWLGAITPLGGILFIAAWIQLAVESYRHASA